MERKMPHSQLSHSDQDSGPEDCTWCLPWAKEKQLEAELKSAAHLAL